MRVQRLTVSEFSNLYPLWSHILSRSTYQASEEQASDVFSRWNVKVSLSHQRAPLRLAQEGTGDQHGSELGWGKVGIDLNFLHNVGQKKKWKFLRLKLGFWNFKSESKLVLLLTFSSWALLKFPVGISPGELELACISFSRFHSQSICTRAALC